MADTAHHYSQVLQASSFADQLSLSANEHTAPLAGDEHRELPWHDSPTRNNTKQRLSDSRRHDVLLTNYTHTHNHFTALWNLSGTTRVSRYQKKHSPINTHRGHQSSQSAFSIYYEPWHPPYSIHVLCSLFPQSLSKFSLVYLLAWYPPLHRCIAQ